MSERFRSLQQALDDEDISLIENYPNIKMILTHGLSLSVTLEDTRGTHFLDPTPEQYCAFTNKIQSLSTLLQLSASFSLPFGDIFNPQLPRHCGASGTLLTMAVHNPAFLTDTLEFLLNYLRDRATGVSVDDCDPMGLWPLYEAVRIRNVAAVRLLIAHGANPIRPRGRFPCALVVAVRSAPPFYDELRDACADSGPVDIVAQFLAMKWNPKSARPARDGVVLEQLSGVPPELARQIRIEAGRIEQPQEEVLPDRIPRQNSPPPEPARIPRRPAQTERPIVRAESPKLFSACFMCKETSGLEVCRSCGQVFCVDCIDGHVCDG
jgi:hypothetical protein